MVTEQIIEAVGRAAEGGFSPKPTADPNDRGGIARLGAAAQLYAVKTNCACPSCQALRKMADLTMSAVLVAGLEQAAAEPAAADTEAPPVVDKETADAPGEDPPA